MSNLKELQDSLKQNDKERVKSSLLHRKKLRECDSKACDLMTCIDEEKLRIEEEFKQVKKDWENGLYEKEDAVYGKVHLAWRAETEKHSLSVVREIRKKGYSIYVKYGIFQQDISRYKKKTEREDGTPFTIPPFPVDELPEGWTYKYRGIGWVSKEPVYYVTCSDMGNYDQILDCSKTPHTTYAYKNLHYFELIPPSVEEVEEEDCIVIHKQTEDITLKGDHFYFDDNILHVLNKKEVVYSCQAKDIKEVYKKPAGEPINKKDFS